MEIIKNTINKFQDLNIFVKNPSCVCGSFDLKLVQRKRNKDGNELISWRCIKCQKYKSVLTNSFFSLYKKSFLLIVEIIKLWCIQISISKSIDLLKLQNYDCCNKVIQSVYSRIRHLCSYSNKHNPIILGGLQKVVEIDETLLSKVKYNRGSALKRKQVWLFGIVERGVNGRCYLEIVPNRKAETLLQIIYDHVAEGSIIISDSWSSYKKIKELKNFTHLTVNHKYNFIDPESGAHTNKIEGLWNQAKKI